MQSRKKFDLQQELAALNTPCPICGYEITRVEIRRLSWAVIECPKCGEPFSASLGPIGRLSWVDKHPRLSTCAALLSSFGFACAAHYLHPNSLWNFVDWTWAAMSLLAFFGLLLYALSDYF